MVLQDQARTTSGPGPLDDWPERLQTAVAETLRRREARHQQRQEQAERRAYGLTRRHARKLNRKDRP